MPSGYEQQRERIVENVEQNRLELKAAVQDLAATMRSRVREVRNRIDVRRQIGERPLPWLGASFAVGLLLGTRKWLGRTLRGVGL